MIALLKRAAKRLLVALVSVSMVFVQIPAMAQTSEPAEQAELDRMLAPIALYPDALLTQILMASTYPIEVVQAARWSKQHPELKGEDAVEAVADRDWDPSVKALVAFPQILERMDQQLEWTTALGDAFLAHEDQVMDTVQRLRQRAHEAGNLSSNEHVRIIERERVIVIEPAHPRVVYVPWYDPWVVYGAWWWPAHPPVRWAHWHGYHVRPGAHAEIVWGIGIGITVGLLFAAIDWPHRHVKVVHVHHPVYRKHVVVHRGHPGPFVWRHNPVHRRGVVYRDHHVRERYDHRRSADAQGSRHQPRADESRRERSPSRIDVPRRDARPEARVPEVRREPSRSERDAPRRDESRETRREPRSETPRDARPELRRDSRIDTPREARPGGRSERERDAVPEVRRESRVDRPRGLERETRRDLRSETRHEPRPETRRERNASGEAPRHAPPRAEVRSAEPARSGRDFAHRPHERSASPSGPREIRERSRGHDARHGRPEARPDAAPGHRSRASRSERRDQRRDEPRPRN